MNYKTEQLQFLQSVSILKNTCDIHLSQYNLSGVRTLSNISPLRWVKGINLRLIPGSGQGSVLIGDEKFRVVYAWGGRNVTENNKITNWNDRTSYTVLIEGDDCENRLRKIVNDIIFQEQGSLTYQVSFRKYNKSIGINSVKDFKRISVELENYCVGSIKLTKKMIEDQIEKFEKSWVENKLIDCNHSMQTIETDRIPLTN